jgi:hypothetical protein
MFHLTVTLISLAKFVFAGWSGLFLLRLIYIVSVIAAMEDIYR